MLRYIAQRLLAGLLTAFLVSLILFVVLRIAIGDPAPHLAYEWPPTPEQLEQVRETLGLNTPLYEQYLSWIGGWITGDWGESWFSAEYVWENFVDGLPTTLQLVVMAQAIAVLVGIPAGVLMALKRNSWIDRLWRTTSGMWLALPIFWTAILLLVAGLRFYDWRPKIGYIPPLEDPMGNLIMFIWPALILGIPVSVSIALMMRSSTLDALRQDYVQAMSVSEPGHSAAVFLHTLSHTLVPAVATLGLTFPAIVGGVLLVERVFWLDGVGHLLVEALNQRDSPIVESLTLFFCVWIVVVNTLVDILCGWLTPGVRSTRKSPREEWDHLANPVRLV